MEQNYSIVLNQIQNNLLNISNHIYQINSIIIEINNIINQYQNQFNFPKFNQMDNFNLPLNQINNNINFLGNLNQNLNQDKNFKFKINVNFELININDGNNNLLNGKKNIILEKETTINDMLKVFLERIGRQDCINKDIIGFLIHGERLRFGDKRTIEYLFGKSSISPTITVYYLNNFDNNK